MDTASLDTGRPEFAAPPDPWQRDVPPAADDHPFFFIPAQRTAHQLDQRRIDSYEDDRDADTDPGALSRIADAYERQYGW